MSELSLWALKSPIIMIKYGVEGKAQNRGSQSSMNVGGVTKRLIDESKMAG